MASIRGYAFFSVPAVYVFPHYVVVFITSWVFVCVEVCSRMSASSCGCRCFGAFAPAICTRQPLSARLLSRSQPSPPNRRLKMFSCQTLSSLSSKNYKKKNHLKMAYAHFRDFLISIPLCLLLSLLLLLLAIVKIISISFRTSNLPQVSLPLSHIQRNSWDHFHLADEFSHLNNEISSHLFRLLGDLL